MIALAQSQQAWATAARLVSAAGRWWWTEIKTMLPVSLRHALEGRRATALLVAGGDSIVLRMPATGEEIDLRHAGRRNLRSTRAIVCVPPDAVLRTVLALPAAVEENLAEVLLFELDRRTPFAAAEVWVAHRILGRDRIRGTIDVELAVVPRRIVGDALAEATRLGLAVDLLDLSDPIGARAMIARLDGTGGRARGIARLGGVRSGALALGGILAVAALLAPVIRSGHADAALREQLATARLAATRASEIETEIDRLAGDAAFLSDRRRREARAIDILAEVTRRLPDGTWLEDFSFDARDITLAGYSNSSSGLILRLTQSNLIAEPHFESPVTVDAASGRERFTIRARRLNRKDAP